MENESMQHRTDHEDEKDQLAQIHLQNIELDRNGKEVNERLRQYLMKLPQAEMTSRIDRLNLSDKSLDYLCDVIAMENEDYEICMVVQSIRKQRAAAKAAGGSVA